MTDTVIHLPQTDAAGLSENWLFKHCGEMHWDYLCAAMGVGGVNSEEMRDDEGKRLYPTFVAIRGRYAQPLSTVGWTSASETPSSSIILVAPSFNSTITFRNDAARFDLEMLTTFVARNREGLNDLHQSLPASSLSTLRASQRAAGPAETQPGAPSSRDTEYDFLGPTFRPSRRSLIFYQLRTIALLRLQRGGAALLRRVSDHHGHARAAA